MHVVPQCPDVWFDECLASRVFLRPIGLSYVRVDDGGNMDGVLVGGDFGQFDLPKSSETRLTELEAIAQDDIKPKLRELRQEFAHFPADTYLWMWSLELPPGADSRYMPAFNMQAHEDEFRRLRALSIRAAQLLAELRTPNHTESHAGPEMPAPQTATAGMAVEIAEKKTTRGRPPGVNAGIKANGTKLRELRGAMTQAEFADKCMDVSEDTVQRAETGIPISPAKLKSIAEAFSIIHSKPISADDLTAENTAVK